MAPARKEATVAASGATSGAEINSPLPSGRIQKVLSRAGICSRRAAEGLVREGRICVNGAVVHSQGLSVGYDDVVMIDGRIVNTRVRGSNGGASGGGRPEWIALHKPKGVLCAGRDAQGRTTVSDMLSGRKRPDVADKYAVVGKLEAVHAGLVILSTEKGCAVALNARECAHVREYEVVVKGHVTEEIISKLQRGVTYGSGEGRVASLPAEVDVLELTYDMSGSAGGSRGKPVKISLMNWRMRETRQRMIRRMCEAVNHELVNVKSLAFGPVRLGSVKKGSSRFLTPNEIKALKRGIGGSSDAKKRERHVGDRVSSRNRLSRKRGS